MEQYKSINDNEKDIVIKVFINNKFVEDDIVFQLINEYDWSSETKKYISQIKNNSIKKPGCTLVKYFSQFRK